MPSKIKNIEIQNFKFFNEKFLLKLNGANLLVFGENGAGKSSLYWSVYTHFQAVTKTPTEAAKYFVPGHRENLRNRYCDSTDPSGIWIEFDNGGGHTHTYEDSSALQYVSNPAHCDFMRKTMISSDFLNYKLISKLFDFNNSQDNEIFEILRKEVFQLVALDEYLFDVHNVLTDSTMAADWWNYISNYNSILPRNSKSPNTFNQGSEEYKTFLKIIAKFDTLLSSLLYKIFNRANQIIQNEFKIPVRLGFDYESIRFNERVKSTGKKRDGKLYRPKIKLYAELTSTAVKDNSKIYHPKSFFNEAKISSMGIAFRLAILEQRSPVDTAGAVLLFDDILVSLDMSLRKLLVPILLGYADKWQLLIFTHDRGLFRIYQDEIARRQSNNRLEEWKIIELYSIEETTGCLSPIMIEDDSLISKARRHLHECRIPECANTLRRCCEKEVKRILPLNKRIHVTTEGEERIDHDLNSLLGYFRKYIGKECKITALAKLFPGLDTDRKLILNPFSHDDIDTSFYRDELKSLLADIEKIATVESHCEFGADIIQVQKFRMALSKILPDGTVLEQWVHFYFCEKLYVLKYDGVSYHNNPKVQIIAHTVHPLLHKLQINKQVDLRTVYDRLYQAVLPGNKDHFFLDKIEKII